MSDYFRKEKFNKDRDTFIDFMVYIFIVALVGFIVVGFLSVAKSNTNKAVKNCENNGYTLSYCKLIAR